MKQGRVILNKTAHRDQISRTVGKAKKNMIIGKKDWRLVFLFAMQPCLDTLAFWTQNDRVTPAGIIRLLLMILLPCYILFHFPEKRRFLTFLVTVGSFCALHALNCLRNGYISPVFDIRYMASVAQMPVYAVSFLIMIRDERMKESALTGVCIAAVLTVLFLILAKVTGTGNVTYGEGLGYSGWVIDDNRNANSTNLIIYSAMSLYLALRTKKCWPVALVAVIITTIFLSNGTKGCYYSLYVIFLGHAAWMLLEKYWLRRGFIRLSFSVLVLLCVFSALIYPWTPRYRVDAEQRNAARGSQGEIEATLFEQGIDITDMSPQERFNNPAVKAVFEYYYWHYLGVMPDIIDRFGMDRVLMQYKMSTDVEKLIDSRIIERQYANMIYQDSDLLTKIVGFEVSEMGFDGLYDIENDWHAIFYYYGYMGFLLYVCFVLYFFFLIGKRVYLDFSGSLTLENYALLLTLLLNLGLAHFSGATLRRPNVSIWLSLMLALVYYVTTTKEKEHETQRNCPCL